MEISKSLPERLYESDRKKYEMIPPEIYRTIKQFIPILCIDGYVIMPGGILLVRRAENPAKGYWWPIGGRKPRGLKRESAIKKITERETGLNVDVIKELGSEDVFFDDDVEWLKNNEGVETTNIVYALRAINNSQKIKLDKTSSDHRIITDSEFRNERASFHWYVRKYLGIIFNLLNSGEIK